MECNRGLSILFWIVSCFLSLKETTIKCFSIHSFATVTTSRGALIIGGVTGTINNRVACYNNAGWSKLDDLQSVRAYHRAIINGNKLYVVGGGPGGGLPA